MLLILPIFLYSSNFSDLINSVDNNLLVKSKMEQTKALKSLLEAKKAKNYPFADLQINTTRLNETPTTILHIPGFNSPLPMGTKTNIDASLSITYPLFTGFAITNSIEKAKLEVIKNELETQDLKRKLYLSISTLYAQIFTLNKALKATKEAKIAMEDSYKKAKGLYNNGLINISNLYKIEAQKYDIEASIRTYSEQKQNTINNLKYLTNIKTDINILPNFGFSLNKENLINTAMNQREDIKVIKTNLKIDDRDIELAKSKKYPQIALFAALKRQGDDFNLDGNGFTNADQSYIGASLKWNIFDGNEQKSESEAAIYKKNAQNLYFTDYIQMVKKDIKNSFLTLASLAFRKKATSKEVMASKSYYELTNGRFDNSLASADELSRSIADLAKVKAKLQGIHAQIFLQKCKISLLAGTKFFLKEVK